ncbi:hypothetical protein [Roseicella aquatilis]|uniref:Uncharacterized protein n=1 Tax=Roseicella aquatilis TaxID=2527868 RepID=A0A4R4DDE8_9PROT|nr:hypothetical protein [Roseicella aquatilis]TCZ58771.1 hypothetical protein EXY23_16305 [Roseicella aquatilis]
MRAAPQAIDADNETADHSALRLMLSYVEAECLRMGATDAARHAALAASLMPEASKTGAIATTDVSRPRGVRLH